MKIFSEHWNSWQWEGTRGRQTPGKGLEHCDLGAVKVWPAESKTLVPGNRGTKMGSRRTVTGEEEWEMLLWGAPGKWGAWGKGRIGNVLCYSSYTAVICQCGVTGNERDPHFCRFLHILVILAGLQAYIRAVIWFFLFITEICSTAICRSFSVDIFFLCLCESKDQPTTFHIS